MRDNPGPAKRNEDEMGTKDTDWVFAAVQMGLASVGYMAAAIQKATRGVPS